MKKIMFNDRYGLTKAVLEGRKTMTRRIIPSKFFTLMWDERDDTLVYENDFGDFIDIRRSKFCQYKVGEIVAVAQSYENIGMDGSAQLFEKDMSGYYTRTDLCKGWRNKMFIWSKLMPHYIRITGIRCERLQDITEEDCIKEGIQFIEEIEKYYFERFDRDEGFYFDTSREAFSVLIDKVSGRGTWQSNPYVWVYEFELIK